MATTATENSASAEEFSFAEAWKPDVGGIIRGEVTEVSSRSGDFGDYPIVTVRTDEGDLAIHAFHTALRNQLAEMNVQPGDSIGVLYSGKVKSRSGDRSYESYRVRRIGGPTPMFDWNAEREAALEDSTPDMQPNRPLEDGGEDIPF